METLTLLAGGIIILVLAYLGRHQIKDKVGDMFKSLGTVKPPRKTND